MNPNGRTGRRDEVVMDHAMRAHEDSAVRHDVAAELWDARGEAARAAFERRCATMEHQLAQLEATRTKLQRLSAASPKRRDGVVRAEIERLTTEVMRRSAQLKAEDAALEEERVSLKADCEPAQEHHDPPTPSWILTQRDRIADERERIADERERIADKREQIANRREELADQRERLADERDDTAEEDAAARLTKAQERRERQEAQVHRDAAAVERQIAAEKRNAANAIRQTQTLREHLSETMRAVAETLDQSAILAEEHSERQKQARRADPAAEEHRLAEHARDAARRARQHAKEWVSPAAGRRSSTGT